MKGQTSMVPMIPIFFCSENCVREECPVCKCPNLSETKPYGEGWFTETKPYCPDCGQALLWDWDEIDKKAHKTAGYKKYEKEAREAWAQNAI